MNPVAGGPQRLEVEPEEVDRARLRLLVRAALAHQVARVGEGVDHVEQEGIARRNRVGAGGFEGDTAGGVNRIRAAAARYASGAGTGAFAFFAGRYARQSFSCAASPFAR